MSSIHVHASFVYGVVHRDGYVYPSYSLYHNCSQQMFRKISSGKKLEFSQPRNFSSPKFPEVKRKFYEEILRSLYSRTEISTRGVPVRQYWMIATAVRTHDCVLCCTHTCMKSHKRCPRSLDERAWQDCYTRWNDD